VHRLRGENFAWVEVRVTVLWPDSRDPARARNDDSLVLRLEDGKESFLPTGDIERAVERSILANGDGLAANVLKVPQHGGKTSSTPPFLDAVQPAIAALSVGEANPFGHPSPEAVERIVAEGTRLYRTDKGRRHQGNYRRPVSGRRLILHLRAAVFGALLLTIACRNSGF
jgi:beta-lactamase superfamily II metal-dependent hydrolase